MKFLLLLVLSLTFSNFASAGLYLAGEGSYIKTKSSVSYADGMTSFSPGAVLGYGFGKDKDFPAFGLEAGWRKHKLETTISLLGSSGTYSLDDTIWNIGGRYWMGYFGLKAGVLYQQVKTGAFTLLGATVPASSSTETGYYFGLGLNVPLSAMFSFYVDGEYMVLGSDLNAIGATAGLRVMF